MKTWIVALSLLVFTANPALSEPLKGSVQIDDVRVAGQLALLKPQWDIAGLAEHCSCLNPNRVKAVEVDGQWNLVDDRNGVAEFGTAREAAEAAVAVVKKYEFVQTCWAGRSRGGDLSELRYFKTAGGAPVGAMEGEDALKIDPENVKAELIRGTWKVTCGDHWMLDYKDDQAGAEQARDIIRIYGFTNLCFVGKPTRAMMYFRK